MYGVVWHPFECWEAGWGEGAIVLGEKRKAGGGEERGVCLMIGVV